MSSATSPVARLLSAAAWSRAHAAGVVAGLLVLSGLVGVVRGDGFAAEEVRLGAGSVWLASASTGQLALVDGSSASVAARVVVSAPGDDVEVVQNRTTGYVANRSTGTVVRVDPVTWAVSGAHRLVEGAGAGLRVAASDGALYALDAESRVGVEADPATLARRGLPTALPVTASGDSAVLATDDGLLVVDAATGEVVRLRVGGTEGLDLAVSPRLARFTTLDGRPAVVDPASSTVRVIDRDGPRAARCLGSDAADPTVRSVGLAAEAAAVAVSGALGQAHVADLRTGRCEDVVTGVTPRGAEIGQPVETGGLVFVPDVTSGAVTVVDVARRAVTARTPVLPPGTPFELTARDGYAFYNDPGSERAGVISRDGTVRAVAKYDVSDPTEGVLSADVPGLVRDETRGGGAGDAATPTPRPPAGPSPVATPTPTPTPSTAPTSPGPSTSPTATPSPVPAQPGPTTESSPDPRDAGPLPLPGDQEAPAPLPTEGPPPGSSLRPGPQGEPTTRPLPPLPGGEDVPRDDDDVVNPIGPGPEPGATGAPSVAPTVAPPTAGPTTAPPTQPPVTQPPVTRPPTQPPVTQPPTQPPVTAEPTPTPTPTEPPATEEPPPTQEPTPEPTPVLQAALALSARPAMTQAEFEADPYDLRVALSWQVPAGQPDGTTYAVRMRGGRPGGSMQCLGGDGDGSGPPVVDRVVTTTTGTSATVSIGRVCGGVGLSEATGVHFVVTAANASEEVVSAPSAHCSWYNRSPSFVTEHRFWCGSESISDIDCETPDGREPESAADCTQPGQVVPGGGTVQSATVLAPVALLTGAAASARRRRPRAPDCPATSPSGRAPTA